jgi:hypothetical protein
VAKIHLQLGSVAILNEVIYTRLQVEALAIRLNALKELFLLHGSYAPRDLKEAAQFGIKVVVVDIPRPPKHHPAIDVEPSGNGKSPTDNNGRDSR